MDRRIERSRQALRTALMELIKEKPYEDIQILDITERADTAKVTFYRHYRNKDELFLDLLNVGWQQIVPLMQNIKVLQDITDLNNDPPTLALFLLLETDRLLYKRLCQTPKLPFIIAEARRLGVQQITSDTPDLTEFDAQQIMTCIIGNALWWLLHDVPYTAHQMARITHWLSMGGTMAMHAKLDRLTPPMPALREATIQPSEK